MDQPQDEQKPEQKRKRQIIFVIASFAAVFIVGVIAFFALSKIRDQKLNEVLTQDQFEGVAEVSSQLQVECQTSANRLSILKNIDDIEAEYKKNVENCKDVYFAVETDTPFRKEGLYADLVVDIAHQISEKDIPRAIALLKFAHAMKPWDFYLGPVSCDSQQVLDAYIESYSSTEEKSCVKFADFKSKIASEIQAKNFSFFSKIVSRNNVVWLGVPESDVGCPERTSSLVKTLSKLAVGPISMDNAPAEVSDNNNFNVDVRLSDKENVTLVFSMRNACVELNSVLLPSLEVTE